MMCHWQVRSIQYAALRNRPFAKAQGDKQQEVSGFDAASLSKFSFLILIFFFFILSLHFQPRSTCHAE